MTGRRRKRADAAPLAALTAQETAESAAAWAAVDAASVYVRDMGDDGHRAVIHAPGIGSWVHDYETTAARFAKRFPSLSQRALADLVRAVDGRAAISAQGGVKAAARRTSWMNWRDDNAEMIRI